MKVPYNGEETDWEDQIERALFLWRTKAEEYRVLPFKYFYLLEEKRRHKISPIYAISPTALKAYPEIDFFRILDPLEAEAVVVDMEYKKLRYMINTIEDTLLYNHVYVTLKNWVKETLLLISMAEYEADKKAAMRRKPVIEFAF